MTESRDMHRYKPDPPRDLITCQKHGCCYPVSDWCPLCKKEYLEGMIKIPDPEQQEQQARIDELQERWAKAKAEAETVEEQARRKAIADLEEAILTLRTAVQSLAHERDALERERNVALQALANEVTGGHGPSKIRMDPQQGLQGWCLACEEWHDWAEWAGGTEDRDSPGGSPH